MAYTRYRAKPSAEYAAPWAGQPFNHATQRHKPVMLRTGRGDVRLTLAEADDLARQLVAACAAARRAGAGDG